MANDMMKDYIPVAERIGAFYAKHPDGSLQSELIELSDKRVVIRAYAYRNPTDEKPGIGLASMNIPGSTSFTRGSEVENTETSAWGRAIAALGFEVKRGIATREDVESKQSAPPPQVESESLLGELTRTGKIAKGDGAGSDLQYRQGPDGHSLHFRLDIPGKNDDGSPKNIPQVWAEADLGETMYAAGIDPEKLKGEKATCTGKVYAVSFPGRRTFHRMKLSRIVVGEVIIPPADVTPLRAVPDAPEPTETNEPSEDDVADLDAATEALWPAGMEAKP